LQYSTYKDMPPECFKIQGIYKEGRRLCHEDHFITGTARPILPTGWV
jgi:hypothetical protein